MKCKVSLWCPYPDDKFLRTVNYGLLIMRNFRALVIKYPYIFTSCLGHLADSYNRWHTLLVLRFWKWPLLSTSFCSSEEKRKFRGAIWLLVWFQGFWTQFVNSDYVLFSGISGGYSEDGFDTVYNQCQGGMCQQIFKRECKTLEIIVPLNYTMKFSYYIDFFHTPLSIQTLSLFFLKV